MSQTVRLDIRVLPRSPKTVVGGMRDGRLIVRVTAPPVDNAANEAAVAAIAKAIGVAVRTVRVVAGATSRNKTVEVDGARPAEIEARLSVLAGSAG